ncbi:Alcohol dehydrogenase transcription factor MYB [Forsythia ovata]|uniref:Alcohol dehydrogenase transcription factor MYB n=1 Tax=Forsythia ovata TaxID=205694 RepID=A0ABD1SLP2_9LAMI
MATTLSPSSSSPYDDHIPTATLALPSIASASASRRLPPPCWSHDETVALIDAYKEKWYSLRRGNLRATHWQEVADEIAIRCSSSTPKTAVQCRHKMEKLRKRYRSEIQRAAPYGGPSRISSAWVHFQSMHSMEKGPNSSPPSSDDEPQEEEDNKNSITRIYDEHNNNYSNQKGSFSNQGLMNNGTTSGFRIKIPGKASAGHSAPKVYGKFYGMGGQTPNNPHPKINSTTSDYEVSGKVSRDGFMGRDEMGKRIGDIANKKKGGNGMDELVAAIETLGEGFVRMEKVKMDMAREVEQMRMQMELKRTEMILESQKRIVEAFADAIADRKTKKAKKMSMPEC